MTFPIGTTNGSYFAAAAAMPRAAWDQVELSSSGIDGGLEDFGELANDGELLAGEYHCYPTPIIRRVEVIHDLLECLLWDLEYRSVVVDGTGTLQRDLRSGQRLEA